MDRVKTIESFILQGEDVLLEVIEKKTSVILMADDKGPEADYLVIVNKGDRVNYNVGDIVLRFNPTRATGYDYRGRHYVLTHQSNITLACKKEDFINSNLTLN